MKKILKIASVVVVAACIIVLLIVVGMFAYNQFGSDFKTPNYNVSITCSLQVDSLGTLTPQASAQADSIIHAIEIHEHLLNDKYIYFVEQKENIQDFFTWAGVILTIIISICAFFGFKSFDSIEERIRGSIEPQISQTAETTARSVAEKESEKCVNDAKFQIENIKNISREELESYKKITTQSLSLDIRETLSKEKYFSKSDIETLVRSTMKDEYLKTFSDSFETLDENTSNIDSIKSELDKTNISLRKIKSRLLILERMAFRGSSALHDEDIDSEGESKDESKRDDRNPNPFEK